MAPYLIYIPFRSAYEAYISSAPGPLCGALSLSSCSRSGNGSGDEPNPRPRPTVPIDNGRYTLPLLIYPSTLDAIKAYEAKQGSVLESVEEFLAGKYYNYKPKSEDVLSINLHVWQCVCLWL